MKFQLSVSAGFAKLAKLRKEEKTVEIPTTMSVSGTENDLFWKIGDGKDTFTMNIPPSSLDQKVNKSTEKDLVFIANILMHRSLDSAVIKKQLTKTFYTCDLLNL